jgi:hypothetical protein
MPTIPPPSAQGSIVMFGTTQIGRLTDWKVAPGTARFEEVTNVGSPVLGTGVNTRVLSQYDCLGVDPGGADVSMRDVPPFVLEDCGKRAVLSVSCEAGTYIYDAFLETFDTTGRVGQFLVGTARFRYSGFTETA